MAGIRRNLETKLIQMVLNPVIGGTGAVVFDRHQVMRGVYLCGKDPVQIVQRGWNLAGVMDKIAGFDNEAGAFVRHTKNHFLFRTWGAFGE